jgi:serine/threonine protein kinase
MCKNKWSLKNVNYTNVSERVKFCVRVLHKLKIIHKDIKPDNILFSHRYNNFVMTDFGISHSLYEECGHLSYTYQDGT